MNIDQLEEKLGGTFDLKDVGDCRKVIKTLLRDLELASKRSEKMATERRMLAFMVSRNKSSAKKKADEILKGSPKKTGSELLGFLSRMSQEADFAKGLDDKQLVEEVLRTVWGDLDMDGRASAVMEELIERFKTRPA